MNNFARAVILYPLFLAVTATITQFKWNDCGTVDPNRAIQILDVGVSPMPVQVPGDLTLRIKASVTKAIPRWNMKLDVRRHTFISQIHIPCTNNIGSCIYDGCTLLPDFATGSTNLQRQVGPQVEKMFTSNHFNYTCPIPGPQSLNIQTYTLHLPKLSTIESILADGDYTVEMKLLNIQSGELYGCIHFDAALHRTCTGIFCGIGK